MYISNCYMNPVSRPYIKTLELILFIIYCSESNYVTAKRGYSVCLCDIM